MTKSDMAFKKAVQLATDIINYYYPNALAESSEHVAKGSLNIEKVNLNTLIQHLQNIRNEVQLENKSKTNLISPDDSTALRQQAIVGSRSMEKRKHDVLQKARQYSELVSDYLDLIESDVMQYSNLDLQNTQHFVMYFSHVIRNVHYKLKCIQLTLLSTLYSQQEISPKCISERIQSVIQTLSDEMKSLSAALSAYDNVGVEFHELVKAYSQVCADVEQLKLHLTMMQEEGIMK